MTFTKGTGLQMRFAAEIRAKVLAELATGIARTSQDSDLAEETAEAARAQVKLIALDDASPWCDAKNQGLLRDSLCRAAGLTADEERAAQCISSGEW
jgi:hypothetical protein